MIRIALHLAAETCRFARDLFYCAFLMVGLPIIVVAGAVAMGVGQ